MEKHVLLLHHPGFIRKNTTVEKSYCQIEPKIQRLVACMNTSGMKTYASCQGHGLPVRKRLPCVAFTAPPCPWRSAWSDWSGKMPNLYLPDFTGAGKSRLNLTACSGCADVSLRRIPIFTDTVTAVKRWIRTFNNFVC